MSFLTVLRNKAFWVIDVLEDIARLVIGDSPILPDCYFDNLMEKAGYNAVWKSCRERGIRFEAKDFREDVVVRGI